MLFIWILGLRYSVLVNDSGFHLGFHWVKLMHVMNLAIFFIGCQTYELLMSLRISYETIKSTGEVTLMMKFYLCFHNFSEL